MNFKAVEFMRNARDRIYEETKNLSWDEQKEYYKKHSQFIEQIGSNTPNNSIKSEFKPSAPLHV